MLQSLLLLLIIAGLLAIVWFICAIWMRALSSVMATEENQFPAKHDKILWVMLFLCAPLFAPFIYTACVERFNKKDNS